MVVTIPTQTGEPMEKVLRSNADERSSRLEQQDQPWSWLDTEKTVDGDPSDRSLIEQETA
jgi:hypothetical protein